MRDFETRYRALCREIIQDGAIEFNARGEPTRNLFHKTITIKDIEISSGNVLHNFPLLTSRKLHLRSITSELQWFMEGSTDERRLAEIRYGRPREDLIGKKTIWTANADLQGRRLGFSNTDTEKELGAVYGKHWKPQLAYMREQLKEAPASRRIYMNSWQYTELDKMALPPCHTSFQINVVNGETYGSFYMRGTDMALGLPFNIPSYYLLFVGMSLEAGFKPRQLTCFLNNPHIYQSHVEPMWELLNRTNLPKPPHAILDMDGFKTNNIVDSVQLIDYNPLDHISFSMVA